MVFFERDPRYGKYLRLHVLIGDQIKKSWLTDEQLVQNVDVLNKIEPLPNGTLLLPNDYQFRRGNPVSGVILESKDDLWGINYRVHLSNGNTRWIGDDVIRDLFDPV